MDHFLTAWLGIGLFVVTVDADAAAPENEITDVPIDEIVVVANRAERSIREVAANVTVISRDDFSVEIATSIADILRYAPGIDYHLIGGHSRGQMGLTVNTERGPVFLASDAIHLFQEVDEERPFIVFYDMAEMLEGYRTCARLAGERAFLVPGHDPIVTDIYPAVRPELEGLVLDLGKEPKEG